MGKTNEDGESISSGNLAKVFSIGLAFNKGQQANELVGSFTENRLRQRKIDVGMTFSKYAIGLMINPIAGATYAVGDLAYRNLSYGIQIQKKNREAEYYKGLSGRNSNSGRRYRGDYV